MTTAASTEGLFDEELLAIVARLGVNCPLFGNPRQPLRPLPKLAQPSAADIYSSLQNLVEAREALFAIMHATQIFDAIAERMKWSGAADAYATVTLYQQQQALISLLQS